jgi:hypothetical protein
MVKKRELRCNIQHGEAYFYTKIVVKRGRGVKQTDGEVSGQRTVGETDRRSFGSFLLAGINFKIDFASCVVEKNGTVLSPVFFI